MRVCNPCCSILLSTIVGRSCLAFSPTSSSQATTATASSRLLLASAGTMQPSQRQPSQRQPSQLKASADSLQSNGSPANMPKLIVFDLDNTLWTPELYQLRNLDRSKKMPIANKDVKLFPGVKAILNRIRNTNEFKDTKFAIASRTNKGEWANDLLEQFNLDDIIDYVEIFPSQKKKHFSNIAAASGIAYHDMIFFDDARGGKYGNCEPVAQLGVLSVHCPSGLQEEQMFDQAIKYYKNEWDGSPNTIIEWDGSVSQGASNGPPPSSSSSDNAQTGKRQTGKVSMVNNDKRYGFIRCGDRKSKDVFFHFNSLPDSTMQISKGDAITFTVNRDPKNGKLRADNIEMSNSNGGSQTTTPDNAITMRTFSMNLPFAALLATGYKTLESRNGTMFVPYPEGTKMLLHVGKRTYPDGNKHITVMKSGGLDDDEIKKLKALPNGFSKGNIVAICEIGKTYETTVEERSDPDFQRKVAAFGADSGRIVTEIKRAAYLKKPVKASGQGGVFKVQIDRSVLPDGWLDDATGGGGNAGAVIGTVESGKPVFSISG